MRWTDTIDLVSYPGESQDGTGAWHRGEPETRTVFCNRRTLGLQRRTESVDLGMRGDAEVEVRTCDYRGETEARYLGTAYDCEATANGDFTYLTLGRRVADA